jgi:hypothetical protein
MGFDHSYIDTALVNGNIITVNQVNAVIITPYSTDCLEEQRMRPSSIPRMRIVRPSKIFFT